MTQKYKLIQWVGSDEYVISEGTKAEMKAELSKTGKCGSLCGYFIRSQEDQENFFN